MFVPSSKLPYDVLDHPCAVCGCGTPGGMRHQVHDSRGRIAALLCDQCVSEGRGVDVVAQLNRQRFRRLVWLAVVVIGAAALLTWWLV